jgi:hypothetical protein
LILLGLECPLGFVERGGLDISSSLTPVPAAALRENIVFGSADAAMKEALGDKLISALADGADPAADDEAVDGFEEKEEKTEPNTRFAFSLEASFPNSTRNPGSFFGSGVGGFGLRSRGMKPAGSRVICMECGRRCRGRQGGSGSLTGCDLSANDCVGVYDITPLLV